MVMCWEKDKRAPTRPSASKAVRECVCAGRVRVNRKRVREVPRSQFWSVQPLRRVSSFHDPTGPHPGRFTVRPAGKGAPARNFP